MNTRMGQAARVASHLDVRRRADRYAHQETRRYLAQMLAYQVIPTDELLMIQAMQLETPISSLVSRPGVRVSCDLCGEEIINARQIWTPADGRTPGSTLCCSYAGYGYYRMVGQDTGISLPLMFASIENGSASH